MLIITLFYLMATFQSMKTFKSSRNVEIIAIYYNTYINNAIPFECHLNIIAQIIDSDLLFIISMNHYDSLIYGL